MTTEAPKDDPVALEEAWLKLLREVSQVTASRLIAEYKANEVNADGYFRGRLVLVRGVVNTVGRGLSDEPYVLLESGERFSVVSVQAFFSKRSETELASLRPGNVVHILGKCKGKSFNVLLEGCQLVDEADLTRLTPSEAKAAAEQRQADARKAAIAKREAEILAAEKAKEDAAAKAIADQEQAERSAASSLKIAKTYLSDGKAAEARKFFLDIAKRYPDTVAGKEAAVMSKR